MNQKEMDLKFGFMCFHLFFDNYKKYSVAAIKSYQLTIPMHLPNDLKKRPVSRQKQRILKRAAMQIIYASIPMSIEVCQTSLRMAQGCSRLRKILVPTKTKFLHEIGKLLVLNNIFYKSSCNEKTLKTCNHFDKLILLFLLKNKMLRWA